MKKNYLARTALLFRKAIWLFVFVSFIFSNDVTSFDLFSNFSELLSPVTTESKKEMPRKADEKRSVPFSNSGEEKSDSNNKHKDLDETIYSKNRRVVLEKTKLVFNPSYAALNKSPENDPLSAYFPSSSNTCFASLYRFTIF